ncbi:MAG: alpha/beta hydrolase [Syntrophobacterales bacterium]
MSTKGSLLTEDFFIRAAGRKLRVRRLTHPGNNGQDSQPTLVFLHEGLGSIEMWHDFPEVLLEKTGCNGLLYDRWGHGRSDPLDGKRTLRYVHDEALDSLPDVLRRCEVDDSVLIGHSDGGSIALIFAAEYSERVRGIITEAAHVFVEEITLEGIKDALEVYRSTDLKEKLARYHGDNTERIFRAWHETWLQPEFKSWNIEDCLPKIKCPVLVIQGEDDQYGTIAQVEAIAHQVAGPAKPLLIPDCAHIPHKEATDRVIKEMTEFILKLL